MPAARGQPRVLGALARHTTKRAGLVERGMEPQPGLAATAGTRREMLGVL